jgi:hypothetical protein
MLIISVFFLVFGFSLNASKDLEERKFTVYTLSSAELSGDTYTSKTTFDDSDMWETEPYSESNNTSVITTAEKKRNTIKRGSPMASITFLIFLLSIILLPLP